VREGAARVATSSKSRVTGLGINAGRVAARKKKIQVPYAQTGWFPRRNTSKMHFRFGNHPVFGFAAATPPNLGGDTLACDTFITGYKSLPRLEGQQARLPLP
jgi:hypothetical protein